MTCGLSLALLPISVPLLATRTELQELLHMETLSPRNSDKLQSLSLPSLPSCGALPPVMQHFTEKGTLWTNGASASAGSSRVDSALL